MCDKNLLNIKKLNKTNVRECFSYLVERLRQRAINELSERGGEGFKGIAESKKVNEPSFAADAISLAIVKMTFDQASNTHPIEFSMELHALSYKLGMDTYVSLEFGNKQQILDKLERKEELITKLIEAFYNIDESIEEKCAMIIE